MKKSRAKQKHSPIFYIAIAAVFIIFYFVLDFFKIFPWSKTYITKDTVVAGDYKIEKGKTVVLKNGAKLTVEGKTTIDGTLECKKGPLSLEAKGELVVGGVLLCNREDSEKDVLQGINLVILGDADFTETSVLAANSNIQIVDNPNLLLKTQDEVDKAFDEIGEDSGEGSRIGPFVSNATARIYTSPTVAGIDSSQPPSKVNKIKFRGRTMRAGDPKKPLDKHINLKKVPKKIEKIILEFNAPDGHVELHEDGSFAATDGQDGQNVTKGCDIDLAKETPKQRHGMRVRIWANTLTIYNNFRLTLGDGGKGGDATTDKDCYRKGTAKAGHGGEPGNFKFSATNGILILGSFIINPGSGGDGGTATANARGGDNGCPGKAGGNTEAVGGNGGDAVRTFSAVGNVNGSSNTFIGSLRGGNGGNANANPGSGGNATKCDCNGAPAGVGSAVPGTGGKAILTASFGVKRLPGAQDEPGKDGESNVTDGVAGVDGGKCPTPAGGSVSLPGTFEFIDSATGSLSNSYGLLAEPHVIVSTDGSPDVRNLMPVTIEVYVDGRLFWTGTIEGDPSQVCRGADGCSMNGKPVGNDWNKVEVKAYDKDGNLIASHTETK